ncbi:GIY-YIG nuclease family protein (plasmid) [Marinovum sp. KMM 9989]
MRKLFDITAASKAFPRPADPGFIYLFSDRGRYKVGRTIAPEKRIKAARTWIPDIQVIGMKPFWFHSELESYIHVGLAAFAFDREWFDFEGDEFKQEFIDEFSFFKDEDPIGNTRSFAYFVNGTGMNGFTLDWSSQGCSKRQFLRDNSTHNSHQ